MCTVTWRRIPAGYQIFFNRDELRTREAALPPELSQLNGVRYLAPRLSVTGGTWLAVNEKGLSIGLLENTEVRAGSRGPGTQSRGNLIPSLMDAATQEEVAERLHLQALTAYQPFMLLIWSPDKPVHWHRWDGFRRTASVLADEDMPVCTSLFEPEAVAEARRARFQQMVTKHGPSTPLALAEYHRSTDSRGGPYSVLMTRPDALTVSYSRVTVAADEIKYFYAARCADTFDLPLGKSIQLALP